MIVVNKTKLFKRYLIYAGVIFLILFLITSCAQSGTGYRKVTLHKPGVIISFEYPARWEDPGNTLKDTSSNIDVLLVQYPTSAAATSADITFQILVSPASATLPNAQAGLNYLIKSLPGLGPGFNLLGPSPTLIAGIQGEMVTYSAVFNASAPLGDAPSICRNLYFNYQGQIWVIDVNAHQDISEQANTDFNHIIQSFKLS